MSIITGFHEELFPTDISFGSTCISHLQTTKNKTKSGFRSVNIDWDEFSDKFDVSYGVKTLTQAQALRDFFHARKTNAFGFRFLDWFDYSASDSFIAQATGLAPSTYQLRKLYYNTGANIVSTVIEVSGANTLHTTDGSSLFENMLEDMKIYVRGFTTAHNNNLLTVVSVSPDGATLTVLETIVIEAAGNTITISQAVDTKNVFKPVHGGLFTPLSQAVVIKVDGSTHNNWTLNYKNGQFIFDASVPAQYAHITASFEFHKAVAFESNELGCRFDSDRILSVENIILEELNLSELLV